jgi:hypothetical protein
VSHDNITYGAITISGNDAFLKIFILSDNADVDDIAQQDPQYVGMCYYLKIVK